MRFYIIIETLSSYDVESRELFGKKSIPNLKKYTNIARVK